MDTPAWIVRLCKKYCAPTIPPGISNEMKAFTGRNARTERNLLLVLKNCTGDWPPCEVG